MSAIDVEAIRAATPGCATVTHFNHAGCSLMSAATQARIEAHLRVEATRGGMESEALVADELARTREDAARLFHCDPTEIAFTGGTSHGWGLAFAALPPWRAGDRILVSRQEWSSNIANALRVAKRHGVSVEIMPAHDDGTVDVDMLRARLDERVRLLMVTWMPANGGLINPIAEIGAVARAANIVYFIDGAQGVGQYPLDVRAVGCDMLCAPGRKHLRGPRGTGLLYARRAWMRNLEPAYIDVHSAPWQGDGGVLVDDARRFEMAEHSVALILGLGVALREALHVGIDNVRARVNELATRLRAELSAISGVRVLDIGREKSALVSFDIAGHAPSAVRERLRALDINVAVNGRAYTPYDMAARGLNDIVRATPSYFTSDAEIERLLAAIAGIARG